MAEEEPAGTVAPSFREAFPGLQGSAARSYRAVGTRREQERGGAVSLSQCSPQSTLAGLLLVADVTVEGQVVWGGPRETLGGDTTEG